MTGIGGNLVKFQAGQFHRMALESSIDDHYLGGIINKYFGQHDGPIYWAVWTNLAREENEAFFTSPRGNILLANGF